MPPSAFSVRGKEYNLLWKKPWILVKYDVRMLGAKNNDSPSGKQAIVKFYTLEYRKCGKSNSKNDSRPCMGASAFLKSVDFRAFEINVKTIAHIQRLYQPGHAIWHGQAPRIISTFLESYDFSGKTMIPFCTSHSSGIGSSADNLHDLADEAKWMSGRRFGSGTSHSTIEEWIRELELPKANVIEK